MAMYNSYSFIKFLRGGTKPQVVAITCGLPTIQPFWIMKPKKKS
jgi:hypothetical protein